MFFVFFYCIIRIAAGTETVRCLLCGQPRRNIAGANAPIPAATLAGNQNTTNVLNQTNTLAQPNLTMATLSTNPPENMDLATMKSMGPSVSTRTSGNDGNSCFVYGKDGEMYIGRSPDGKPIVASALANKPETNYLEHLTNSQNN